MDLRKLKTLIDLVSESNISELEITEAEGKVRIVKAGAPAAPPRQQPRLKPKPRRSRPAMWSPRQWSAPSTARPAPAASR